MAFKLPPNSLFAVLLRAPWWVSTGLAVVLGLAAAALLPAQFRLVGGLSGLPLLVIGAIAAKRQWHLPGAARVQQTQTAASAMAWPAFHALLAESFRRNGFVPLPMAAGHDAVDLVLQRGGRHLLLSARRWKSARLGVEPLRALQAARQRHAAGAGSADVPQALCICLGGLSDTASSYAREHGISLWQAAELAEALRGMPLPPAPARP